MTSHVRTTIEPQIRQKNFHMADGICFRPSRSSHHDGAFFAATNEYSHGSQPSGALPRVAPSTTAMTTESPSAVDVVDFYEMIDQPRNATSVQLRSRINELYAEAQVNRDHRNVEKRHQYTRLLQWIPPLRSILLHEGKRAKYDTLLHQSQSGDASVDFRTALNDLLGESEFDFGEGESILGIRNAAPAAVIEPEARLSSRLDAIAVAAGQGAARANAVALSGAIDTVAPAANTITNNVAPARNVAPNVAARNVVTPERNAASSPAPAPATSTPLTSAPALSVSAPAPIASPTVAPATAAPANISPTSDTTKTSATSTRSSSKIALNPDLLRERASLSASAIGVLVLFVVLLTLRAMLGVESNLAALVGIAFVAGFVAWRAVRRILMARVPTK